MKSARKYLYRLIILKSKDITIVNFNNLFRHFQKNNFDAINFLWAFLLVQVFPTKYPLVHIKILF